MPNTQTPPRVFIAIPVWNKSPETVDFFCAAVQSIREHVKIPYHLGIYDNASPAHEDTSQLMRFLESLNGVEHLTIFSSKENVGFGPAVNILGRTASAVGIPYFAQMNSDCELVEDTFAELIDVIEKYEVHVAFPEHYENCKHYKLDKENVLMGNDWRFGALWVMPTHLFSVAGGFDEQFSMCYWEDTDLWRRLESAGRTLRGWRGTWVKHKGGASSLPDRDAHFNRNKALFEAKWGSK